MGTISNKIEYLEGTKDAIRTAIESKGIAVSDTDTFRSYATKISQIDGGSSPGQGVPIGGTANQVLVKNSSTDYDTSWKFVSTPCARFSQTSTVQVSKDVAYGGVQIPMNSMDYSFGDMFSLESDGNCYYNGDTPAIIHFDSTFSCILEEGYAIGGGSGTAYSYVSGLAPDRLVGTSGKTVYLSGFWRAEPGEYISLMLGNTGTFSNVDIYPPTRICLSYVCEDTATNTLSLDDPDPLNLFDRE